MLPAPGFHHLHLNSVDPDAAIDFYVRQFPSTSKTSWGGLPALTSPNNVLVLFTKVDDAAADRAADRDLAFRLARHRRAQESRRLPGAARRAAAAALHHRRGRLGAGSAPTPGRARDGVLGLTRAQIAEAKAKGVQPTRKGGFAYMAGPTTRSSSTCGTVRPSA